MPPILQHRCHQHPSREAAARCPACGHFYCRECVTEHEGRVLCAGCLRLKVQQVSRGSRDWSYAGLLLLAGVGFFWIWMMIYSAGSWLARQPNSFDDESAFRELLE